jgi:hypothetical protein
MDINDVGSVRPVRLLSRVAIEVNNHKKSRLGSETLQLTFSCAGRSHEPKESTSANDSILLNKDIIIQIFLKLLANSLKS